MAIAPPLPKRKQKEFVRPLNGGIRNDLPSTLMPPGSFKDINGFIAQPYGLRRRPATSRYGDWTVDFPPIQGLWTVRSVTGASYSVLMDRRKIYIIAPGSRTAVDWTYTTGTVSATAGSKTVTGSETAWATNTNWILAGDRIFITGETGTANETNAGSTAIKTYIIASVDSATQFTLETAITAGFSPSGATYVVYRSLGAAEASIAAPVNVNDTLYFTDGQRPIQTVTNNPGNAWALLNPDHKYTPHAIAYFGDRLWVADINDPHGDLGGGSGLRYRQRIAWSNLGVGNLNVFDSAYDFIQLPYGFGAVRRLMPMSQFLIAYFTDSIWFGQPSNLPSLPLQWTKFETGGMGLVTPLAVTAYLDGHFFVGQDDIYFVSQRGVQGVGTPVVKDMLKTVSSEAGVRAVTDYSTSTVVFGIPTSGSQITELWRFNVKTKGWSKEDRATNFMQTDTLIETISWDNLEANIGGTNWEAFETYNYNSWDTLLTEVAWNQQLFFNVEGELYFYQDDSGDLDADSKNTPIGVVVTGDHDMGYPDLTKIWTSFSLELESPLPEMENTDTLNITLEGSTDKGISWKKLGALSIEVGGDEDEVNFRLTGSAARFRLRPKQEGERHQPYTLGGYGLTFLPLGDEVQGR